MGIEREIFVECSTLDALTCRVCYNILLEPVAYECRHFVCKRCMERIQAHARSENVEPSCPYCRTSGQLTPGDKIITDVIKSLEVICYFDGCTNKVTYSQRDEHLRTCKYRQEPCEHCGEIKTLHELPLHVIFCINNPDRKPLETFCADCRDKLLQGLPYKQ